MLTDITQQKENVFRVTASTPFGTLEYAIVTAEYAVKTDALTVIQADCKVPFAMIKIKSIKKSNRRILNKATEVKGCYDWGYFLRKVQ